MVVYTSFSWNLYAELAGNFRDTKSHFDTNIRGRQQLSHKNMTVQIDLEENLLSENEGELQLTPEMREKVIQNIWTEWVYISHHDS